MRPTLTVASSLTPHQPWWRDCAVPSEMVTDSIALVRKNMLKASPILRRSGVAVVIRVPENPR